MICAFPVSQILPALFGKEGHPVVACSGGSSGLSCMEAATSLYCVAQDPGPEKGRPPFTLSPFKKLGEGKFPNGFTLVEIIVTILAAGILGAIFINFMGTAMSKSTRSVEFVQAEARAEAVMEQIVADYVLEINRDDPSGALAAIKGNTYGSSAVSVSMDYITFNTSGAEQSVTPPGVSNTLKVKVTIINTGHSLTNLLTQSRISNSPRVAF